MSTNLPRPTSDPPILSLRRADLNVPGDQLSFLSLLDAYMRHPMGANRPMPEGNKPKLLADLREHPGIRIVFAMDQTEAVGMAVCFLGYSTFYAQPLLNIHDLFVQSNFRGKGVGKMLLQGVEDWARELNCCKVTLEVHGDNARAQEVYRKFGFDGGRQQLSFWTKLLTE